MKFIYLLSALFFLSSCGENSNSSNMAHYYDVKSFTESLINDLSLSKPDVNKKWVYNAESEEKKTDNIDWNKELKLFIDADINKSSYLTSYDSLKTENKVIYTLRASENLPIKEISITFDSLKQPSSISSLKESNNYFFKTRTSSTLNCKEGQLESYTIASVQKLLWFVADSSYIEGKIL
jgi:uncharacterized ubiquitin-like protein YukD